MHRGCFGGCAFCTISAHQGKFIASRSEDSILREVKTLTQMPDFKGISVTSVDRRPTCMEWVDMISLNVRNVFVHRVFIQWCVRISILIIRDC